MKRLAVMFVALALTAACNANDNGQAGQNNRKAQDDNIPVKTQRAYDEQIDIRKVGTDEWKDGGLRVERATAADISKQRGAIPSEPDMEREEKVLLVVKESEKYVGKELDNLQFIQQVYQNIGIQGLSIMTDIPKASNNTRNVLVDAQPGDIVYFDLNGDGEADHYAIKLGNGDIIHTYTNGKIRITDIERETFWKNKVVYVQRVF